MLKECLIKNSTRHPIRLLYRGGLVGRVPPPIRVRRRTKNSTRARIVFCFVKQTDLEARDRKKSVVDPPLGVPKFGALFLQHGAT